MIGIDTDILSSKFLFSPDPPTTEAPTTKAPTTMPPTTVVPTEGDDYLVKCSSLGDVEDVAVENAVVELCLLIALVVQARNSSFK